MHSNNATATNVTTTPAAAAAEGRQKGNAGRKVRQSPKGEVDAIFSEAGAVLRNYREGGEAGRSPEQLGLLGKALWGLEDNPANSARLTGKAGYLRRELRRQERRYGAEYVAKKESKGGGKAASRARKAAKAAASRALREKMRGK